MTRAVNPRILRVARAFSKELSRRGIPHALIGGLAVGEYGYERATADVDFLVSGEAQSDVAGDPLGGEVQGKTVRYRGVDVDLLFPGAEQDFLEADIRRSKGKMPIIPQEVLIYLKLIAPRAKDNADIVELIKRGKINLARVRAYLRQHRPDLMEDFDSFVALADSEPA